jgi:hypothetical protein
LITVGFLVVLAAALIGANVLVGHRAASRSAPAAQAPSTIGSGPSAAATAAVAPAQTRAVFGGRSSDGAVAVAVAVNGDKAAAYLCDGQHIEAWLQGSVSGDKIILVGRNGAGLTGSISGQAMFGTVSAGPNGMWPFSAKQSAAPAGVYQYRREVNGLATRIGWAVLPDGTQVCVADSGATKSPAPRLDYTNNGFVLDGMPNTASPVSGTDVVVGP